MFIYSGERRVEKQFFNVFKNHNPLPQKAIIINSEEEEEEGGQVLSVKVQSIAQMAQPKG